METCDLAAKECIPCKGGVPPLKGKELKELHHELGNDWQLVEEHHIAKEYSFDGMVPGLEFVKKIVDLAEQQGHHPDIELTYGSVKTTIFTHKIDGLTESDFILAAKIDQLFDRL